jgi:tyrosine-specific transport protein
MHDDKIITGSVFGGMLLVAGSCIGAGMLALPVLTGLAGFVPSVFLFIIAWAFMTFTALLIIEANGWFLGQINYVSMIEKTLGSTGRILSWILYLFLFYSLLSGYIGISGIFVSSFFQKVFSISIPASVSSLFFVLIFGVFVFFGTRPVDFLNRSLMAGLIITYLAMLVFGFGKVQAKLLSHINMEYSFISLSVLITSFGFHNMIPSLTAYMKGDLKKMRITVIGGSLLALLIYFLWNILIIGIVPFNGDFGLLYSYKNGIEASVVLQENLGSSLLTVFTHTFAFFAIITSFLAQALSLMHFIADGLKVQLKWKTKWWLCLLTLFPPTLFSLLFPGIFYKALGFAGGFCAVILFGVFPVIMIWIGRYKKKMSSSYFVFGGNYSLIIAMIFSVFVVIKELFRMVGWSFLGQ